MKSVRLTILVVVLLLVALPMAALAAAHGYERVAAWLTKAKLAEVVLRAQAPGVDLGRLAADEKVWLRRLGPDGTQDSGNAELAVAESWVGASAERVVRGLGLSAPRESVKAVDAELPPWTERDETQAAKGGAASFRLATSRSDHVVVFAYAAPAPGGAVLHAQAVSHRGIRQLIPLRGELGKLVAYQLGLGLLAAVLLGRWLGRPLEELARGARGFPRQPLALPGLLAREDEIGQLARSISALAHGLDDRRRATAELAADLAHEYKNPLATIAASAELIASSPDQSPERRQLVASHIRASVDRLARTTDELLGLLRLEVQLPQEPRSSTDHRTLIDGVLQAYRIDPRFAGHRFTLEVLPGAETVFVVPAAWVKLLRNLVDNALVHCGERKEVAISARPYEHGVLTVVRDFGPGVSPGNRDKVFRRFFTHRPPGAPDGTGLGLSIVSAVAEAHGGWARLGEGEGPGAAFEVYLPP